MKSVVWAQVSVNELPPVKDRILYWPIVLSAFWYWCLTLPPAELPEGSLRPGPVLVLAGPMLSFAKGTLLSVYWLGLGAWRRLVSTLILPITVLLLLYFEY
jgi:hypothetical protein